MQSTDILKGKKKKTKTARPERIMRPMDLPFLLLVILLLSIGTIMMFSASYATAYYKESSSAHFLIRQGAVGVAGVALMLFISRMNYQSFRMLSFGALAVAVTVSVPAISSVKLSFFRFNTALLSIVWVSGFSAL